MSLVQLSPQQTKEALRVALKADVVAMVTGMPASGKSSIVKQLAEEEELLLIDLRLSQIQSFDLIGLPKVNDVELPDGSLTQVSTYVPMDVFPLETYTLPVNPKTGKQYKGALLFLDELNSADKYVQAASYRLLLDREVGNGLKLHPDCRIIAAGNRLADNAIVHKMGTAIRSRIIHIEMTVNRKEFLTYVEDQVSQGLWSPIVLAFLNFRPELINNFDPKKDVDTFASPRTYELLSKQLMNGLLDIGSEIYLPVILGTIGESAGSEFNAFLQIMNSLPSLQQIENDPANTPLPSENGAKYALGAFLADKVNKNNVDKIVDYLERVPEKDLLVLAYRMILPRYPQIMSNKKVLNSLSAVRHKLSNQP